MLSLSKNLYLYQKWGFGRSPKRGEGGSPSTPLSLGRGQGDRDSKLEICFKNRLFLQAKHTVHYNDALYALNLTNEGK